MNLQADTGLRLWPHSWGDYGLVLYSYGMTLPLAMPERVRVKEEDSLKANFLLTLDNFIKIHFGRPASKLI